MQPLHVIASIKIYESDVWLTWYTTVNKFFVCVDLVLFKWPGLEVTLDITSRRAIAMRGMHSLWLQTTGVFRLTALVIRFYSLLFIIISYVTIFSRRFIILFALESSLTSRDRSRKKNAFFLGLVTKGYRHITRPSSYMYSLDGVHCDAICNPAPQVPYGLPLATHTNCPKRTFLHFCQHRYSFSHTNKLLMLLNRQDNIE